MKDGGRPAPAGRHAESLVVRGRDSVESRLRCAGAQGHGETISLKSLMVTGHKQAWAGFHQGATAGLSAAIVLGAAQGQGRQWHLPGVPGSCCLIHTPAEYKGAEPPQMCPEPGAQDSVPGWPSGDSVPAYHPRRPCLVLHNHCPPNFFFQVSPCREFIRTRGWGGLRSAGWKPRRAGWA